jgi:hypothetical protein
VLGLGRGLARCEYAPFGIDMSESRARFDESSRMIFEKLRWRRELLGDFELNMVVNYGGLPFEEAKKSIRLFSKEVLPEIQSW